MNKEYQKILKNIFNLVREDSVKLDLSKMKNLDKYYDYPIKKLKKKLIHVTGTNGKGTLCNKLYRNFLLNNYNTGMFTSPHITTFRERIQYNNNLISKEDVIYYFNKILKDNKELKGSFFEITAINAFKYLSDRELDYGIIEVGIGGSLDGTNIIEDPLVSVITSIGLDHINYLGNTKKSIAYNKSGIFKPNCPVVLGYMDYDIEMYLKEIANKKNCKIYDIKNDYAETIEEKNNEIFKSVIYCLYKHYGKNIIIHDEIYDYQPSCRRERLKINKSNLKNIPNDIYLDVGHNLQAFEENIKSLKKYHKDIVIVCGFSSNKDYISILKLINNYEIFLVKANNPRLIDPNSLELTNDKINRIGDCSIKTTLDYLFNNVDLKGKNVLICGSFFIMEETKSYFNLKYESDGYFLNEHNIN